MNELTLRDYRETYEESAILNEFANSAKRRAIYFSLMPNPPARVLEIGCAEGVFQYNLQVQDLMLSR